MNRDDFLARVRDAAAQGARYRVASQEISSHAGYVGGGEDLPASLADEIDAVAGTPHLVDDIDAARDVLRSLLGQYQPRTALCWQHPVLDALGIVDLLAAAEVERLSYDTLAELPLDQQRQRCLAADLGITSVDYAVAETGSLALASAPGRERMASLLPPVYVTVVTAEQIVPDLYDLFDRLVEAGVDNLPSNLVLITGPSKSGDIEAQMTLGVHGPNTWHVIIVRDQSV